MTVKIWVEGSCPHQHTKIDDTCIERCADCGEVVRIWEKAEYDRWIEIIRKDIEELEEMNRKP